MSNEYPTHRPLLRVGGYVMPEPPYTRDDLTGWIWDMGWAARMDADYHDQITDEDLRDALARAESVAERIGSEASIRLRDALREYLAAI
jgi:hypothetical protein